MKKSIASPKTRVELNENLLADVTGGGRIGGCAMVDGNGAFAGC